MNIAIIGSRTFNDYDFAEVEILNLISKENIKVDKIVSGGAKGADKIGEIFAEKFGIPTEIFLPDWKKFGKSAGFKRNTDIVKNCDIVIAFWDGESHGTLDSIKKAENLNKKVYIIYI